MLSGPGQGWGEGGPAGGQTAARCHSLSDLALSTVEPNTLRWGSDSASSSVVPRLATAATSVPSGISSGHEVMILPGITCTQQRQGTAGGAMAGGGLLPRSHAQAGARSRLWTGCRLLVWA